MGFFNPALLWFALGGAIPIIIAASSGSGDVPPMNTAWRSPKRGMVAYMNMSQANTIAITVRIIRSQPRTKIDVSRIR